MRLNQWPGVRALVRAPAAVSLVVAPPPAEHPGTQQHRGCSLRTAGNEDLSISQKNITLPSPSELVIPPHTHLNSCLSPLLLSPLIPPFPLCARRSVSPATHTHTHTHLTHTHTHTHIRTDTRPPQPPPPPPLRQLVCVSSSPHQHTTHTSHLLLLLFSSSQHPSQHLSRPSLLRPPINNHHRQPRDRDKRPNQRGPRARSNYPTSRRSTSN
ncbi:hypothetical protein QBC41DRAFT_17588 [Cercophora samala]|uniref:Uncharacterized protein n=1 Tax=Cercophora samala TaxID=330535 RepID=A0AA40D7L7_9PEZI|nr:hypothetical protein QBC41DRAFT_17588 [Cercophora samala]